jgi:mono/diheme cytochrome c family protein
MRASVVALAACVAFLAAGTAPPACAQISTVLGYQALARRDAPSTATTTHARAAYVLHCAGCHGVDGAGAPEKYVPDLRQVGRFLRVPGGREFVIGVPGVMGSGLDDVQVAAVTNWLLATLAAASVPADHRPYDAADVTRVRAAPMADVADVRAVLVARAREQGVALH